MTAILAGARTEQEWLAARRGGVTASEIAVIMGIAPPGYGSAYALYHQKLGLVDDQPDSAVMERGRVLEPYIAAKFAERAGFRVEGDGRGLYAHPERRWQMATPDRVICRRPASGQWEVAALADAVLECKVADSDDEWGDGPADIPVHYRAQALWQMDVMGVPTAHVAALFVRQWEVRTYQLDLDGDAVADLQLMRRAALDFLARIEARDAPDIDWRPATGRAVRALHPGETGEDVEIPRSLAIQYRAAVRRADDAGRRKEEMTNRVLDAIADGRRAIEAATGERVATRSVSHPRRLSAGLVRERYPDVAAACTTEPERQVKLIPARPRSERKEKRAA